MSPSDGDAVPHSGLEVCACAGGLGGRRPLLRACWWKHTELEELALHCFEKAWLCVVSESRRVLQEGASHPVGALLSVEFSGEQHPLFLRPFLHLSSQQCPLVDPDTG